jgi:hypothetical protein
MKMLMIAVFCMFALFAAVGAPAQNVWYSVPRVAHGPRDPDLVGAAVDGIATRGQKEYRARVVVSGPRGWGTSAIGIWVDKLNEVISENDLSPYTGPDLGREASNSHMMEITLVSKTGKVQFNSRMVMAFGGNFPNGVVDNYDNDYFTVNSKLDKQFKTFIDEMNAGFDYGIVTIGRGVFSPPIEVKFGGEGIKGKLMPAMDAKKSIAYTSAMAKANKTSKE